MERDLCHEKAMKRLEEKKVDTSKYPYKRPEKIHLDFWHSRPFENKIKYLIYKTIRVVHVSVWFYFFPFLMLIFNYAQVVIIGDRHAEHDY